MKYSEINEIVKKKVIESGKFPIAKVVIINDDELRKKLTPYLCCNNKNPDLLVINWYFESYTCIRVYVNGTLHYVDNKPTVQIKRTWYFSDNYETFRNLLEYLIAIEDLKNYLNKKTAFRNIPKLWKKVKTLEEVML